jgi:hypothetical protein
MGQTVLLSTKNLRMHGTSKLLPRYIGPFPVTERVSSVAYRLLLPAQYQIHNVVHVYLLKPYRGYGIVQPPPPELVNGEEMYEVEAFIAHKDKGGRAGREYLVKWVGYGPLHDSWEGSFAHARETLQDYLDHDGLQAVPKPRKRKRA